MNTVDRQNVGYDKRITWSPVGKLGYLAPTFAKAGARLGRCARSNLLASKDRAVAAPLGRGLLLAAPPAFLRHQVSPLCRVPTEHSILGTACPVEPR